MAKVIVFLRSTLSVVPLQDMFGSSKNAPRVHCCCVPLVACHQCFRVGQIDFKSMDNLRIGNKGQYFNVPGHATLPAFALVDKPPVAHKQDSSFIIHLSPSSYTHFMTAPSIP